jgi:hypothetical protein
LLLGEGDDADAIEEAACLSDGGLGCVVGPAAETDLMLSPELGFAGPVVEVPFGGWLAVVSVAVELAEAVLSGFE